MRILSLIFMSVFLLANAHANSPNHKEIEACSMKANQIYENESAQLEKQDMPDELKGALSQHLLSRLDERLQSCASKGSFDLNDLDL